MKSTIDKAISNLLFIFDLPVIIIVLIAVFLFLVFNVKSKEDYDIIVPTLVPEIVRIFKEYRIAIFIMSLGIWILIFS